MRDKADRLRAREVAHTLQRGAVYEANLLLERGRVDTAHARVAAALSRTDGRLLTDDLPAAFAARRAMAADEKYLGTAYFRLIRLMLMAAPDDHTAIKAGQNLLKRLLVEARFDAAYALVSGLTQLADLSLRPILVLALVQQAATRVDPEDMQSVDDWCAAFPDIPELDTFARLPAFCAEGADVLPTMIDAPALRALMGRPEIRGGLRNPKIERLFETIAQSLPDDLELMRHRMMRLRVGNRVADALRLCRTISRRKKASPGDLYHMFDTLARLDRLDVIRRYINLLEKWYAAGRIGTDDFASRLWAAGFPARALSVFGDCSADANRLVLSLRCLVSLRRYQAAEKLAEVARQKGLSLPGRLVQTAERACELLRENGLVVDDNMDAGVAFVGHLVGALPADPASAGYQPVPKRVLISTYSIGIGGAERQVTALAGALSAEPDIESVQVLVHKDSHSAYSLAELGDKITATSIARIMHRIPTPHPDDAELAEMCSRFGLAALYPTICAIRELRPEVVHVRTGLHLEVALAALVAGVPRVVVHFGSMTRGNQSTGSEISDLRDALVEKGLALAAKRPELIFSANSRQAANDWARAMGLAEDEIRVIPNSTDPEAFKRTRKAPAASGALVVGGVFRLAPVKDPALWLEVATLVHRLRPATRFLLVGDGPMRPAIEQGIVAAGLQGAVEMPGLITTGLPKYLDRMDVFLMTSRTESLPNAVVEAQLMGLPVVAPDVGGIGEAIASAATGVVTVRTAEALAQAVVAYLDDHDLRIQVLEEAPRLTRQRFSARAQVDATRMAYGWPPSSTP